MAISTIGSRQASAPQLARVNYDDAFSKSAVSKQLDLDSFLKEQDEIKSNAQQYLANQNILQQNNAKISAVLQNNPQILQSIQSAPESVKSAFVKSSKGQGTVESTAVLGSYIDAVFQEEQRSASKQSARLEGLNQIAKTQKVVQEANKLNQEVLDLKAKSILDKLKLEQTVRLNDATIKKDEAEIKKIEAEINALNLEKKGNDAYNNAVSNAAYRVQEGSPMNLADFTMNYRLQGGLIDDSFVKNYESLIDSGLITDEGTPEYKERIAEANAENKQKIKKSFSDMTTLMATADKVVSQIGSTPELLDVSFGMYSDFAGGKKAQTVTSQINTIKAIFGLGNLMRMREANANGAAVGQVSNFEQALFQAISANIGSEKAFILTGKENVKQVMIESKYLAGRIFLTEYYRTVARDGEKYARETLGIGKQQVKNISREIDDIERDVTTNKQFDSGYKQIYNLIEFGGSWRQMSNNLAGEEIVSPVSPNPTKPTNNTQASPRGPSSTPSISSSVGFNSRNIGNYTVTPQN